MGMTDRIRPISICLFSHNGKILVCEFPDSVKGDFVARPLGGGIEFGETSDQALVREIREELGQEITDLHLLEVLESCFEYDGKLGHEIVFVYDAKFQDSSIYDIEKLRVIEGDTEAVAVWRSKEQLEKKHRIVPAGLSTLIPKA